MTLLDAEFQARGKKGLCFDCTEKFPPRHKVKKELNIDIVHDEDLLEGVNKFWGSIEESVNEEGMLFMAHVSINSIWGVTPLATMKLRGAMGEKCATITINYCTTHNFICVKLLRQLQLPMKSSGCCGFTYGNGEKVIGNEICSLVPISMLEVLLVQNSVP